MKRRTGPTTSLTRLSSAAEVSSVVLIGHHLVEKQTFSHGFIPAASELLQPREIIHCRSICPAQHPIPRFNLPRCKSSFRCGDQKNRNTIASPTCCPKRIQSTDHHNSTLQQKPLATCHYPQQPPPQQQLTTTTNKYRAIEAFTSHWIGHVNHHHGIVEITLPLYHSSHCDQRIQIVVENF